MQNSFDYLSFINCSEQYNLPECTLYLSISKVHQTQLVVPTEFTPKPNEFYKTTFYIGLDDIIDNTMDDD